jgi:hypothetical protein
VRRFGEFSKTNLRVFSTSRGVRRGTAGEIIVRSLTPTVKTFSRVAVMGGVCSLCCSGPWLRI